MDNRSAHVDGVPSDAAPTRDTHDAIDRSTLLRRRGRERIARRGARTGALAGLRRAGLVVLGLGVAAGLAARLGLPPVPEAAAVVAAVAILVLGVGLGARRGARRAERGADRIWDASLASPGALVGTAGAILDSARPPTAWERAVLRRFLDVPLPPEPALRALVPAAAPASVLGVVLLAAASAVLAPRLGDARDDVVPATADGGSTGARSGAEESPREAERARLEGTIADLRHELAWRGDVAEELRGVPALAPVVTALTEGGTLAPAAGGTSESSTRVGLTDEERARIRRGAARARAAGAPEHVVEALESIAEGASDTPIVLVDAEGRLERAAAAWERAGDVDGSGTTAPPPTAEGGDDASDGQRRGVDDLGAPTDPDPGSPALDVPEGLPLGPGEARTEPVRPATGRGPLDTDDPWLRRPSLEPRWFPVIRTYLDARESEPNEDPKEERR